MGDTREASRAAAGRALAGIFPAGALVWTLAEEYEPFGPVWRVTLLCQGEQGRWERRRYRYDIPSGTLHYAGMAPASDDDLAAARRDHPRLRVGGQRPAASGW